MSKRPRGRGRHAHSSSQAFRRAVVTTVVLTVLVELIVFLVWGVWVWPTGHVLPMLLWTIGFCGLVIGATLGTAIHVAVEDRAEGREAIGASVTLSALMVGGVCNLVCYKMDAQFFFYFTGRHSPVFFVLSGLVLGAMEGALLGALLFTRRGRRVLENVQRGIFFRA